MKIAVVGSGSKCWSLLKNKLNKFDILEIKAKSIDKIKINYKVDVVLYLADPPCNAINSHLNTTLAKLKPNKFILISSLVVELPDQFNFYRYVKRKKFIENELCNFRKIFKNTKFIYLRCSTIIPDKDIVKNIYPIYTNITQLTNLIEKHVFSDVKFSKSNLFKINDNIGSNMFFDLQKKLNLISFFRPFDIIFKLMGSKNYGYSYHLASQIREFNLSSKKVL